MRIAVPGPSLVFRPQLVRTGWTRCGTRHRFHGPSREGFKLAPRKDPYRTGLLRIPPDYRSSITDPCLAITRCGWQGSRMRMV
jgi:hypothetical protein